MTIARAALVILMNRYLSALMDPSISLLEVHKLMYFLQVSGEPLRLKFEKAHYGPYSENLRHVLRDIDGYLVSGYANGGDEPGKLLELVPEAVTAAESFVTSHEDSKSRFDRVGHLVHGFETPFGLELLATVHWLMTHERIEDFDALREATHSWNPRKRQFSREQIQLAAERLRDEGWISAEAVG